MHLLQEYTGRRTGPAFVDSKDCKLTFSAEGQPLKVSPQSGCPPWAAQPEVLHPFAPSHVACVNALLIDGVQIACTNTASLQRLKSC